MNSSNLRASAREKLAGKWKKAAIATLAYVFVTGLITNINHFFEEGSALYQLFSIIGTIVEVPLSFGFLSTMFKLHDDEEISYTGFFNDGFSNFKKSWGVTLTILLKLLIPLILFIVSLVLIGGALSFTAASALVSTSKPSGGGTIISLIGCVLGLVSFIFLIFKSISYTLSFSVLYDNPEMASKDIVETSAELMKGNIGSYLILVLSFIGWILLVPFTLGIGSFWLIPYINIAMINFYRSLNCAE